MDGLARSETNNAVFQEYARVTSVKGRQCQLRSDSGTYEAVQAISCLLTPQAGDYVLAAFDGINQAYVLAILAREAEAVHQIDIQGELQMRVRQGRLKITSQEGIDMASARDIRTISEKVSISAVDGNIAVHTGTFQGSVLNARIGALKWIADSVESVVQRLTQRFNRLYRTVDEFEQVKAGRMDVLVKKLLSFRSQYTVLTSKEDVKIDGERIHIG